jgi:hypothetical protein
MLLREFLNRTGEGKSCVVGWGRGMGHKGHMYLADAVITEANDQGADPYFVVSRTVGKDDPITPDEKLAIYQKVFPKHGHIFHTATEEMPDLTRVLRKLNEHGYTKCTVVVGADQVNALSYVKKYNGVQDKEGNIPFDFTDGLDVISRQMTTAKTANIEGPRATPMRAALKDPNVSDEEKFQIWRDAMSPELSDEEVRELMVKAMNRMNDPSFGKKEKKTAETIDYTKSIKYANRMIREMRAREFARRQLSEGDVPYAGKGEEKWHDVHIQALRNAMSIPNISMNKANGSPYMQYRFGMAMANPNMPRAGAMSGDPLITAYTDADLQKVKDAAKTMGAGAITHLTDGESNELENGNTVSVVAKQKKNKYGI